MVAPEPIPLHARRRTDAPASVTSALDVLGPAAFGDDQLVALLFGGRGGLNAARRILDVVGDLPALADAPLADLLPIVGERRAAAIVAAFELGRRRAEAWPSDAWQVRTPGDVAEQLLPAMEQLDHEELRVVLLDTKNMVIAVRTVYVGNLAGSSVRVGELFREAVRRQAAALVVAHNHPSGDPQPSGEDLKITGELVDAGRLLDIELLDHLILGRQRWVSLRALGALGPALPQPGSATW
ncbi:MAG TPA: DNA repair protein RadC [Candidatus Limnocylindria bacterium]|nr:DNA repair protein RadC [Candidatus Limnocylindria bacterium]